MIVENTRAFWNVRVTPACTSAVLDRPAYSAPDTRIDPLSGASTPFSRLSVVVLPDPLGPMRPTIPPSGTREGGTVHGGHPAEALDELAHVDQ